jgi:predicted RNA-binding Zn ribbon-like protein
MEAGMETMKSRSEILHGISRIGNTICLDFVNTVYSRVESDSYEYVETYSELLLWASDGRIIPPHLRKRLEALARKRPRQAQQVQKRARELREILYRVFIAVARGEIVEAGDLEGLNTWLRSVSTHRQLVWSGEGYQWEWSEEPLRLDAVLWPVVDSAATLLASAEVARVKECPTPDGCGWLFLDASKNQSRRWCDMRVCGNIAKARRFYKRHSKSRKPVH